MTMLKAMTFNLRVMVEADGDNAWTRRIHAAAQAVLHEQPDILCTQEGRYGMLKDLQAELPGYRWIGEGRRGGREDEHCTIFYNTANWLPEEAGHFSLSEQPETLGTLSWNTACPRMCTWVRLRSLRNGQNIAVFNTHLDHISQEAQIKGMELIRHRMERLKQASPETPLILAGDMNVEPEHPVIRGLEQAGYRNAYAVLPPGPRESKPGRTFHGFRGGVDGLPIDYIFTSPECVVEAVRVDRHRYEGRYPSDHYPVCAVLELPSTEPLALNK
ncbi:endonuclease/exonuclease/phosphatase family protein [Paenibacillus sp. YN15]|uniref:endonuclease/exonuclease/phosphatase family protein n=1 Tax=Paenibacillus sp. YN15 TaxID=1742774 RepID=UPI00215BC174|nr:endonuclease/exonuclease/phosphatase family protein [Paenibacillus sp. YN15]